MRKSHIERLKRSCLRGTQNGANSYQGSKHLITHVHAYEILRHQYRRKYFRETVSTDRSLLSSYEDEEVFTQLSDECWNMERFMNILEVTKLM